MNVNLDADEILVDKKKNIIVSIEGDQLIMISFSRNSHGDLYFSVRELTEDEGMGIDNTLPEYF
jgi:hypothetical protein